MVVVVFIQRGSYLFNSHGTEGELKLSPSSVPPHVAIFSVHATSQLITPPLITDMFTLLLVPERVVSGYIELVQSER